MLSLVVMIDCATPLQSVGHLPESSVPLGRRYGCLLQNHLALTKCCPGATSIQARLPHAVYLPCVYVTLMEMQPDPWDWPFCAWEPEVELHRVAGTCSLTLPTEPVRPHELGAGN